MCEQEKLLVKTWTICKFFQNDPDLVKDADDSNLTVLDFVRWYDKGEWVSGSVPRLHHKSKVRKVKICISEQQVTKAICSCKRIQCLHIAAILLYVQNEKLVQESEPITQVVNGVFCLHNKKVADHKFETEHVYLGRLSSGLQQKPAVIAIFTTTRELRKKINMLEALDSKQDRAVVCLHFPKKVGPLKLGSRKGKFVAIETTESSSLHEYVNLPEKEKKVKGDCSRFFMQLVATMMFVHSEECYLKYFNPDSISVSSDEQRIEIDAFTSVAKCGTDQELAQAQSDNVFALGGLILYIESKGSLKFKFSSLDQDDAFAWDPLEFIEKSFEEWLQPVSQMLGTKSRRPRLRDIAIPMARNTKSDPGEGETLTVQNQNYVSSLPETSLFIQLPPISKCEGRERLFRYCAISMSSGREVSKFDKNLTAVLEGIQPADKYEVLVYEVKEKTERLIAKSIKQTRKSIGKSGGIVEVGCCVLNFPEGAIKDEAFIEIDRSRKNFPRLPENTISIAPIMDFRSTQKVFLKPVSCKITTPYITSPTPVELEIMCYENGKWNHVCFGKLGSDSKVVEFKCDHFTPYTVIIPKPFAEIRNMDIRFDIRNRIYVNEHNIACVTYLDDDSIVGRFEPDLNAYRKSSFVLRKGSLRVGEHFDFSLRAREPDHEFGNWQVILDEDFTGNNWSITEVLPFDRGNFATPVVLSEFMRQHSDHTRPVYRARANLNFKREHGGGDVAQTIVCQGGNPTFNLYAPVANITTL